MKWRETLLQELNHLRVEYRLFKDLEKILKVKTGAEINFVSLSLIRRRIYELENMLREE